MAAPVRGGNKVGAKVVNRKLRPGEVLLKPGEKLKHIYMIQSGRISLCQTKNGKVIEIAQLSAGHSIGDEAAFGPAQWNLTALALRETVVIEVPLEAITEPLNSAPLSLKTLLKALGDRMKTSFGEVKTIKLNREAVPCPADHVAKVFGVIFHCARIVGKVESEGKYATADWNELRKFAAEVFDESVVRLEDAVTILIKLGYASLDGKTLQLTDLKQVEAFFDYYGGYHFKGGNDDLLKTNSKMQKVTEEFLRIADRHPVDRGNNAHLPYKETIDTLKIALGNTFEADQLFRLEQKGLFIKRTATQDGGILSFYRPDFDQMMLNWKVLRELELWNEKGFVDTAGSESDEAAQAGHQEAVDPVAERKKWVKALEEWHPAAFGSEGAPQLRTGDKAHGEVWCSVCMSVVGPKEKECGVCGAKLEATKAS